MLATPGAANARKGQNGLRVPTVASVERQTIHAQPACLDTAVPKAASFVIAPTAGGVCGLSNVAHLDAWELGSLPIIVAFQDNIFVRTFTHYLQTYKL